MKAPELRKAFIPHLKVLDPKLSEFGFKRHPNGIFYARKRCDVSQKIHFNLASNPSYAPGAIAQLYPRILVEMNDVGDLKKRLLVGDPRAVGHEPQVILNLPLEHLVPKTECLQWYVDEPAEFAMALTEVVAQIETWALPLLENYWGPADVISAYFDNSTSSETVVASMKGYPAALNVIAAYLALGRFDEALQFLDARFSSLGAKKRYSFLFKNLPRLADELSA